MEYNVTFLINYTIENAENEQDAIEQAENLFNYDTHFEYDIDVSTIDKNDLI